MSGERTDRLSSDATFALALLRRQIAASFAQRRAFCTAVAAMLVNDLMLLVTWWMLLGRFGQVRGWRLDDMFCLYAVATGGVGLCVILFGGVQDLSRKIHDGELDALLTQPKSVLLQALASRTQASGWGDLSASVVLFAASGVVTWGRLPVVALALGCSALTFAACGVVVHSLAFWVDRMHGLARSLWDFTLTFSLYPPALFGGLLRLVLFTLLPAFWVAYVPVELIRQPSLTTLALLLAGTTSYAACAGWLFRRGLRRYASGSRFAASL
jgi:ABC-2 type transport system permease protein